MRTRTPALVLALSLAPVVATAQGMAQAAPTSSLSSVKPLYDQFKGWLIASAEQMAEENYSFKPTPEVRSFGQLIGHVANSNFMFCSGALGEKNPNSQDFEKATTKAALVKAIKDAFAYCDPAYQMPDAKAMDQVTFFGQQGTRLWVLVFNLTHDAEHYGNVVTYFRLKGMVPPSSQRPGM
jgi:uncharacterized damage-inducible protein DinB